ncbi:hypothetical protein [Lactobacillus corticis]|uniref:Uncharacterized protein n=1 Tax=Lactobacillus corticis TaxID=2201249 RepID=A0A916QKI4_9LACO|nr:hypothetical protein [Lactobacillus corticis]GFZ27036.1 hypothetical protein LCB40_09160 [Lactobacillus corticis]
MSQKSLKRIIKLTFIFLLVMEIVSCGMMLANQDFLGASCHGLLFLVFLGLGFHSHRNLAKLESSNRRLISPVRLEEAIILCYLLLDMISIHDCDHMRQAMGWNYHFTLQVLLVNLIVYVPSWLAIILLSKDRMSGIGATIVSGVLIGGAFLKVHLLGPWIKVWGPWNRTFFALGVDSLSWWILAWTAIIGVFVSMGSMYILGSERQRIKDQDNR